MPNLRGTFRVGNLTVAHLSDGFTEGPRQSWFNGIDPAVWTPVLGVKSADTLFPVNFGGFAITGDGHITLIDTGWGVPARENPNMVGGGQMLDRLAELGIQPEDVEYIIQTHLHADHCGWLVEDTGSKLTFPNARVFVHQRELEYWTGPASDDNSMAPFTRSRIGPVQAAGQVQTFDHEFAVTPSVTALPTPGHTPGHSSVILTSGGEHALLLGDVAHHPVHLEHHDWLPVIDLDPPESIRSREKMAALAVERDALVTAPHMPILTLGRVRRTERGYSYVAADAVKA